MNLVTVSGPPSSGKTSIILKVIEALKMKDLAVGVVKFDCLYTDDDILYEKQEYLLSRDYLVAFVQITFFCI